MDNAAAAAAGPVEEKFATTANRWMGIAAIVLAALLAAWALTQHPGRELDTVLAAIALSLLSWVVMVRPVASVHREGLLLHNMVRDTFIPSSQIERCKVFQTLQVATPTGRYHGLGVGRSGRSLAREQVGPRTPMRVFGFGMNPAAEPLPSRGYANQEQIGGTYTEYVESRILRLRAEAKADGMEPVVAWVWTSVGCLVIAVVCLALIFV